MENRELFAQRRRQLTEAMRERNISCTVVCNSPNLFYMTGYAPKKCERLQIAFFPVDAEPLMVVPALYQMNAEKDCNIEDQRIWQDGADLGALTKGIMAEKGLIGQRIAIDDTFEFRQFNPILQSSPKSEFVPGSGVFTPLRMRKSPDEIEAMKQSGAISDDAVGMLIGEMLSGKTEAELKSWAEFEMTNRGMTHGFSNLVATGQGTASPHHVSGDRLPQKGDAAYLDIGGAYRHYWSDITRSFHIGKPSDKYVETYHRVREAQQLAFEAITPGVRACDVHMVAWNYLEKHGLAEYFIHRLGHGMGMDGHELPNLSPDSEIVLEPGMTFSCEPGVYFKGEWGIRIEDTVAVTETGAISFNHFTKDLLVL